MKKGFTLIELLAVIVILAIIAIIAVPIVLNIINDTKKSATLRSADFYLEAVEQAVMLKNLNSTFNPNECKIQSDGNLLCDNQDILEIEVDGEKPTSGTIKFEDDKLSFAIVNNNYCVTKTTNDSELNINNNIENCIIPKENSLAGLATTTNEVSNIATCATDGTICQPGTPFAIKVNKTETYKFYVLNDDGTNVDLIMASNIGESVWSDATRCEIVGQEFVGYDENGYKIYEDIEECVASNLEGPLTALQALKEKTTNWENIEEYSYELYELGMNNDETYSGEFVQNVRSRLPKESDIIDIDGLNIEELPSWLVEGDSYWLADTASTKEEIWCDDLRCFITNDYASIVLVSGDSSSLIDSDAVYSEYGLRPVITISK